WACQAILDQQPRSPARSLPVFATRRSLDHTTNDTCHASRDRVSSDRPDRQPRSTTARSPAAKPDVPPAVRRCPLHTPPSLLTSPLPQLTDTNDCASTVARNRRRRKCSRRECCTSLCSQTPSAIPFRCCFPECDHSFQSSRARRSLRARCCDKNRQTKTHFPPPRLTSSCRASSRRQTFAAPRHRQRVQKYCDKRESDSPARGDLCARKNQ